MAQKNNLLNTFIAIISFIAGYVLVKILFSQNIELSYTGFLIAYVAMFLMMVLTLVVVLVARSAPESRNTAGTLIYIFLIITFILSLLTKSLISILSVAMGLIIASIAHAITKNNYLSSLFGAFSYGFLFFIFLIIAIILYLRNKNNIDKAISKVELVLIIQILLTIAILAITFFVWLNNPFGIFSGKKL
ncbi:MAG: hypothetical protein ACP5GJ_02485 [Nanopusillaceae archaeon]